MDLAELKFVVITKDLETAADKIKALQAAIVSLNETQKSSSALAKDDASAQQIRIKSTIEMTKLKGQLAQAEANAQEATDRSTKSNNALGDSSDAVTKRLNKQADVLKLTRGQTIEVADGNLTLDRSFRQSQVSALANLKALGATTEQMQLFAGTFKELNTAAGFNPLDKMSSGLTQLTQEVKELSSVSKLMESNVNLSRGALVSLSRDVEATTAAMKAEGKTTQDIDGAIASLTNQYKTLSSQKEVFISQSNDAAAAAKREAQALLNVGKDDKRDQAQQLRETAKASDALEKELKRVDFVLTDVNANLQLSNSNRLLKFQDNLKKSGVTGAEATTQLEAYRGKLELIQKNNAFQKQTLDATEYQKRVDYITRAVGPQLTDIFSGLATGQQSLYTIAIQQGGQLADQFSLAGIEANKMGGILANALPKMYTNISSIAKAFGTMAVSGFMGLGGNIINSVTAIGGVDKALKELNLSIGIMADSGSNASKILYAGFQLAAIGAKVLAATLALSVVGVLVGLSVALYQVIKQEDAFSRTLALNGASLGLSQEAAITYARSLNDVGISTSKALDVISEMAKQGGFAGDEIKTVTQSAVDMQKYAGIAIEDTVKAFAKLKDDPVKAMFELAIATGNVAPEVIKTVIELEKQGRMAEAVAIAMDALSESNKTNIAVMKGEFSSFALFIKELGSGISDFFSNAFKNLWYKASPTDALISQLGKVQAQIKDTNDNLNLMQSIGLGGATKSSRLIALEKESEALVNQIHAIAATDQATVQLKKTQSEAAKDLEANSKIQLGLDDKLAGFSKKELPQQEFVNNAISKYVKELKGAAVSLDVLNKVKAVAAEEWKRAQTKPKESDEQKKLKKATEEFIDIQNKANGVSNSFNNEIEGQQLLLKHNRISLEQYIAVVLDLIKTQKFSTDAAAAAEKVRKETLQTQKAFLKVEEDIQKVRDEATKENLALNLRNELLGKTEEEQLKINRAYETANKLREIQVKLDEDLAKIRNNQNLQKDPVASLILEKETIDAYGKQVEAVNAGIATQASEDMQKSFDSIKSILKDSIIKALFEGGESGAKKLREEIVDAFRNKITIVVDAVVNTIMGTALGAFKSLMTGSGDSSTGIDSLISGGKSVYDAISGGFDKLSVSSQFSNFATSSVGQSMGLSSMQSGVNYGLSASSEFSMPALKMTDAANSLSKTLGTASNVLGYANAAFKLSQGKIGEAAGGAIGQYFGGPLGNMIGSKLGAMVDQAFSGETRNGATYTTGADGRAVLQQGPSGGEIAGSDARRMFETTQTAIVDTLKAVGSKATLSGFVAGLESSSNGKGFQFAGGMINGKGFGESGGRDGGQFSFTSQDSKKAFENYGMQLSQSIVEALQATDDLPVTINKIIKEALGGNAVASLTSDAVNALLTTINAVVQTVNTFNAAALTLPFENIKNLSFDMAAGLIAAAGGISNLTTNLGTFYDNFYSDEEKRQQVIKNINSTTAGSGLDAATATRESFRKLVESQDLTTESGQKMYATLLGVSGAFAGITKDINTLTPALDDIAQAAKDSAEAMQKVRDAERARMEELRATANNILTTQQGLFSDLTKSLKDDILSIKGGDSFGFKLSAQEVGLASKFTSVIESATKGLSDLKTMNLGDEFKYISDGLKLVIQDTRELLASNLANSRLAKGDFAGALSAKMSASRLDYTQFTTDGKFNAGSFNLAMAQEQATLSKELISSANKMALTIPNAANIISGFNSFANSDIILNEIKQGFIKGIQGSSSTTSTYIVRDAVQGLANAFAKRNAQENYGNTNTGLPAIGNAYSNLADTQNTKNVEGVLYMGEVAIQYAEAVANLNSSFNKGKISTEELNTSIGYLKTSLGELSDYATNEVNVAFAGIGASLKVAQAGISSLDIYFSQLSTRANELAESAKVANEPMVSMIDTIGRMNSVSSVFGESARAVISGFTGMTNAVSSVNSAIARMIEGGKALSTEDFSGLLANAMNQQVQGQYGLDQSLQYGSQVRKALLISQGASLASERLTTADASKVQEKLATNPLFDALGSTGIRDVALMLDGLKSFDAVSFEKVFIRISDAFNLNSINEQQYSALVDTSLNIFDDYDNKIKDVTNAFKNLTDAAGSLADQLLIDAGFTSLTGSQTVEESQRQYNEVLLRALRGDVTASGQLGGITQKMLDIAKSQAKSEQEYNQLFGQTVAQLRTVESLSTPTLIIEPIKVQTQSNEDLVNQITLLREELRLSNAQIASNTDKTNKRLLDFQVNGLPTIALV
jgi:phage-related minor tail protein